jgi:HAE1 family hydrophobic/amphiphilic exporter-1
VIEAALEGARLRLRPILMTSFAFIFGCVPLWIAKGAGASARQMLGTAVVSGMLAATLLGVFLVPALFVAVERLVGGARRGHEDAPVPVPPGPGRSDRPATPAPMDELGPPSV